VAPETIALTTLVTSLVAPAPLPPAGGRLVAALLADRLGDARQVSLALHPDDEMLAFLVAVRGGDRDQGLVAYFESALRIYRAVDQIVAWRFGGWAGVGRLLDFASGYGRVTRLLVREMPPERVWIAEIVPAAVEFQRRELKVHGLSSSARPEDFRCEERFDLILVTSLFTHLPEAAFDGWLRRLVGLIAPGGLLVFSTHGLDLLPPEEAQAGAGIVFKPLSESRSLSTADYGSSWVSERFVAEALGRAAPGLPWRRIARGLLNHQDLYLVAHCGERDLSTLVFGGDPEGRVDVVAVEGEAKLHLAGWAHDAGWGDPVAAVEVLLDGAVAGRTRQFGRRHDVARAMGLPPAAALAWQVVCPLPAPLSRSAVLLMVRVRTASGRTRVLHLSSLESALLAGARLELEALKARLERVGDGATRKTQALRREIAAMRASRFWKARDAWFRLKRRLGLAERIEP
jgi:SAM-dependent methyltransferase